MLLDRRRIRKWARWVALLLAIVFVGGFLFMGVGYGGAGFNLSEIFTGGDNEPAAPETPEEKLAAFQEALTKNPADVQAMLGAANVYQQVGNYQAAALYLENVISLDPSQKDVYLRLANLYLRSEVSDYNSAVAVLNKATAADPDNPDVFLKLGTAQNNLGNTEAAILAWQKYLQLAPNGDMADIVSEQITKLSNKPTTTTVPGATTTTVDSGSAPPTVPTVP